MADLNDTFSDGLPYPGGGQTVDLQITINKSGKRASVDWTEHDPTMDANHVELFGRRGAHEITLGDQALSDLLIGLLKLLSAELYGGIDKPTEEQMQRLAALLPEESLEPQSAFGFTIARSEYDYVVKGEANLEPGQQTTEEVQRRQL